MLYIQVDTELIHHPKLKKLARLLGLPKVHAVGHLVALWTWAAQYAENGDLTRYLEEPQMLADAAEWPGDPQEFLDALIRAGYGDKPGFIEVTLEGDATLHDWHEYFGAVLESRAKDAERKRLERERKRLEREGQARSRPQDNHILSGGRPVDAARMSTVNVTYRSVAQQDDDSAPISPDFLKVEPKTPEESPADPPTSVNPDFGLACRLYEEKIGGMLTPTVSAQIGALVDDCAESMRPFDWFGLALDVTLKTDAARIAAGQQGIDGKWAYAQTVLTNALRTGRPPEYKEPTNGRGSYRQNNARRGIVRDDRTESYLQQLQAAA